MSLLRSLAATLAVLLAATTPAWAGEEVASSALDKIYEAADAIDAARVAAEAGQTLPADELLLQSERLLEEARSLQPDLARIGYEQARIHLLRDDAALARTALEEAMQLELPLEEHFRMAELLDATRQQLGQPSLGASWTRARQLRGAGVGVLAGGLALASIGLAVAYVAFEGAASEGVSESNLTTNRAGWALAGIGGAVSLSGGAITVVGQVRVEALRRILPGPWRLARAPEQPSFSLALKLRF